MTRAIEVPTFLFILVASALTSCAPQKEKEAINVEVSKQENSFVIEYDVKSDIYCVVASDLLVNSNLEFEKNTPNGVFSHSAEFSTLSNFLAQEGDGFSDIRVISGKGSITLPLLDSTKTTKVKYSIRMAKCEDIFKKEKSITSRIYGINY
jgi:hypothetical protein